MEDNMRLDRKTVLKVSGVFVIALLLGLSSITIDNTRMIDKENYGIQLSAGANAAFGDSNTTVAGASGAIDASLNVVSAGGYVVGQGASTYGYTNLGIAVV